MKFNWLYLLGFLLVILKAFGSIDLAWVWVLAPFWGPWLVALALPIFVLAMYLLVGVGGLLVLAVAYVLEFIDSLWHRFFRRRSHIPQMKSRYKR